MSLVAPSTDHTHCSGKQLFLDTLIMGVVRNSVWIQWRIQKFWKGRGRKTMYQPRRLSQIAQHEVHSFYMGKDNLQKKKSESQ